MKVAESTACDWETSTSSFFLLSILDGVPPYSPVHTLYATSMKLLVISSERIEESLLTFSDNKKQN